MLGRRQQEITEMATCLSPTATSTRHTSGFPHSYPCSDSSLQRFVFSFPISFRRSSPSPIHLHPPSLPPRAASLRLRASTPSPPPSPDSDPPPENDPVSLTGIVATLSRLQDSIQIFFAVLFWLSLFFWASAWDGRNSGRPNKGSRFRR